VQPLPDLDRILGPLRWVIVGGIALRAVEDYDSLRTLADLEFGPPPDAAL
jgi:hypothetical protein